MTLICMLVLKTPLQIALAVVFLHAILGWRSVSWNQVVIRMTADWAMTQCVRGAGGDGVVPPRPELPQQAFEGPTEGKDATCKSLAVLLVSDTHSAACTDGRTRAICDRRYVTDLHMCSERGSETALAVLNVIRMIKMFGWEPRMEEQLGKKREEELKYLRKANILDVVINCIK